MTAIKVFEYIPELDCFKVTAKYQKLADKLGLEEWNPVVWIGRVFCLDNDYGEHWFDNHEAREALRDRAKELGYESDFLYVIDPDRFKDGRDGPRHPPELRKKFWTDVLKSFSLDTETLFDYARFFQQGHPDYLLPQDKSDAEDFIPDLEKRIEKIRRGYTKEGNTLK